MRLAFWRTEKPVARPVLQPGADSPYVPRLGVWMEPARDSTPRHNSTCGHFARPYDVFFDTVDGLGVGVRQCEDCGAKLVAKLRREREG